MSTISALDVINSLSIVDSLELLAKRGIYPPAPFSAGSDAVRQVVRRAYEAGHLSTADVMEYLL